MILVLISFAVYAGDNPDDIVLFRLRNQAKIFGRILSYNKGEYIIASYRRPLIRIPLRVIYSITYNPKNRPDGKLRSGTKGAVAMSDEEILKMALDMVEQDRRENRLKRMELKKGNAGAFGLDNLLDQVSDKMEDNALALLKEDKELQNIIMDKEIQKLIEKGDYLSLMSNPKILNILRNPKKRQKFMKAFFGAVEDNKKKKADQKPK